jgi:hypothetical protein
MDRDQRPPVTRDRMKGRMTRPLALALVVLLAGCGGHSNVRVNSGGAPSGASAGTSVHVQSGTSTFGTVLAIGILMGMSYGSDRELEYASTRPSGNPFSAPSSSQPAPALDPARRVIEQDCTRPIQDWSANLKCK